MENLTLNNIKIDAFNSVSVRNFIRKILIEKKNQHFITFNLDFLYNSFLNNDFQHICKNADYTSADGFGITSLIYLKYKKRIPRITGNDLFVIILEILDEISGSVALVGSNAEVQSKIKNKILNNYLNIKIKYSASPSYKFEENIAENISLWNDLKKANPDVLFLALGSPRQEYWLNRYLMETDIKIGMGIGAVFDFYSGAKKRSPVFIQKIGLEWFWRFCTEPKRLFKRYFLQDLPLYLKLSFYAILGKNI